jgi:hypothetical protein
MDQQLLGPGARDILVIVLSADALPSRITSAWACVATESTAV